MKIIDREIEKFEKEFGYKNYPDLEGFPEDVTMTEVKDFLRSSLQRVIDETKEKCKEELEDIIGLIVSGLFIEDYDCHEVEIRGLKAVIKIKDIPYAVIRIDKDTITIKSDYQEFKDDIYEALTRILEVDDD